jgi:quercetin dioxygenase-like cupin family protein
VNTRLPILPALFSTLTIAPLSLGADNDTRTSAASTTLSSYSYATNGVLDNVQGPLGSRWKLLLNESNLGGKELEAAELTLPAGTVVPSHVHVSVEIIYVLSGVYDHEVNGRAYRLTAGMVGVVRPGDKVRHLVPKDADTKLLILWAPAGDAARAFAKAKGTTPPPVPELQQ